MEATISDAPPAMDTSISKPPLSFTPDQLSALGLTGPQEAGKEVTITFRAGETQEDGSQSFEVVSSGEGAEDEMSSADASEDVAEGESDAPPSEGPPNLGYDLGKSRDARRKREAPPVAASSFM